VGTGRDPHALLQLDLPPGPVRPELGQQSCNSLLGFGLPASTGEPFVDKIWSTSIPKRDYWNSVLYMLGLLHVSGNFRLYY
jgi:hypothetical protein